VNPKPVARPRVVALGGGHGLAATLQALRRVTDDLAAVVVVSDNGGSSGRLRRDLGIVPPGDLRMALAALCGDDTSGRTWAQVIQHRFVDGELSGHAVGNLLITALWEVTGDVVEGLDWVARLLGAHGRVLPLSCEPLEIVAEVQGVDPSNPLGVNEIRGQVEVATSPGVVLNVRLEPATAEAAPDAIAAVLDADVIVLGPGSWFTSVMPHVALPTMAAALEQTEARIVLVLNLAPSQETAGITRARQIEMLAEYAPGLRLSDVIADTDVTTDLAEVGAVCDRIGATLHVARVAAPADEGGGHHQHDADLLAAAFGGLLRSGRR